MWLTYIGIAHTLRDLARQVQSLQSRPLGRDRQEQAGTPGTLGEDVAHRWESFLFLSFCLSPKSLNPVFRALHLIRSRPTEENVLNLNQLIRDFNYTYKFLYNSMIYACLIK